MKNIFSLVQAAICMVVVALALFALPSAYAEDGADRAAQNFQAASAFEVVAGILGAPNRCRGSHSSGSLRKRPMMKPMKRCRWI